MAVIDIDAGLDDRAELRVRKVARGQARLARRQIAGDDVREGTRTRKRTKIASAAEVRGGISHRLLPEIRIAARGVLRLCAGTVATIAFDLRIDDVAAETDQVHISAMKVERNR